MTNREVKISEYADKRYIDKVGNEYIVRNDGIIMSATMYIYGNDCYFTAKQYIKQYIKDMYKEKLACIYTNYDYEPCDEEVFYTDESGFYFTCYFRLYA